jgi:hypothetical protein
MKPRSFLAIFALFTASHAITLVPDSSSVTIQPMTSMTMVIDSVRICNAAPVSVTIDSIIIKFLNGDSADFNRGKNCDPAKYYEYIYNGWISGISKQTLRYVRDSVFLLQDSLGAPVTISIDANACTTFPIREITNCASCGRLPSFPKTTRYSYTFFSSSGNSTFLLKVNDVTAVSYPRIHAIVIQQKPPQAAFDARGRILKSQNIAACVEVRNEAKRIKMERAFR